MRVAVASERDRPVHLADHVLAPTGAHALQVEPAVVARRGSCRQQVGAVGGSTTPQSASTTRLTVSLSDRPRRYRATDGKDAVDAARHHEAGEPVRETDVMDVRGAEGVREDFARLVWQEDHLIRLEPLRQSAHLRMASAEADDGDREIVEITQKSRRANKIVEVLCVADISRVHHRELVDERLLAGPWVSRGPGSTAVVSTQFGITVMRSERAPFWHETLLHALADGDDVIGALEVIGDEASRTRTSTGFVNRPSSVAISGKTSSLITSSGAR